ncbi:MAG: MAPEG family protein [Henriciella sp.]|nr:MAPEG family protein [Henriciella sp.]
MQSEVPDFSALFETALSGHAADLKAFMTPVLLLICWTLIMWLWMYATRIPAMVGAKIDADSEAAKSAGYLDELLPYNVRCVADNYNHLHEQPTIFYALMAFAALTGGATDFLMYLAYAYVGIRVIHTFVQVVVRKIPLRFLVFCLGTLILFVMAGTEVIRVFL